MLDDLLTSALGWGERPQDTSSETHAHGLSTQAELGAVLENGRRAVLAALG